MIYMFLAEGFEETEAIGCLDVIRRAGIEIKTVSVADNTVVGSHGVGIVADMDKNEIDFENMKGIILPGGMPGTTNLQKDDVVQSAIAHCHKNGLLLAAICAAPMVFGDAGLLKGHRATCYPGFEEHLTGAEYSPEYVVKSGNIITAKGAGAAMLFGAEIVDYFMPGKGREILDSMQHA